MKISKDEQNKKHFRFSYSIRSICFTLCFALFLGINPIYANTINTDVGQGTYDAANVNSEGTLLNTYTTNFRGYLSQLNTKFQWIIKNTYETGSYIATLYTYWSPVLNDLKVYNQNTAATLSALTTIISTDMWASLSYSPLYYDENHSQIQYSAYMNVGTDMYISTPDNTSIPANSILHIRLPISYMSNIQYLTIDFSSYRYGEITVPYYYVIPSMWQIDIYYIVPFNAVGSTYIHLHNDYGLRFTDTSLVGNPLCEYIGPNNSRYKEYLAIMFDYQNHREVMKALDDIDVNVEVNDSINITPIDLDVSIGIEDFTAVNTISNKLRTWLTTGVSVSALIGALDALDDSFFTLSNRNTIENLNNQYTDFYD